jgi:hypothetical protein
VCASCRRICLVDSSVSSVEQVDRLGDLDGTAALLDLARDLEDAADVAGDDHLGPRRLEVIQLAPAEPFRHLRLRQVVSTRGAAADFRLLQPSGVS